MRVLLDEGQANKAGISFKIFFIIRGKLSAE